MRVHVCTHTRVSLHARRCARVTAHKGVGAGVIRKVTEPGQNLAEREAGGRVGARESQALRVSQAWRAGGGWGQGSPSGCWQEGAWEQEVLTG